MHKWVLEEFDCESGQFLARHGLVGLSDEDARRLLRLSALGSGDLFDISGESLTDLACRFDLVVFPGEREYLLGRESLD